MAKIETTAGDLHNAIKNAIPFLDSSGYHPTLSSVHLITRDGLLIAEATNRYVVIQIVITKTKKHVDKYLPLATCRALEQELRGQKKAEHPITLDFKAGLMSVTQADGTGRTLATIDDVMNGPRLDGLFTSEEGEAKPQVALTPKHFKIIASVRDYRPGRNIQAPAIIHAQSKENGPVLVTWHHDDDTWARGLIMPVRSQAVTASGRTLNIKGEQK